MGLKALFVFSFLVLTNLYALRLEFTPEVKEAVFEATVNEDSRDDIAPLELELVIPNLDISQSRDGFHDVDGKGLGEMGLFGKPKLLTIGKLVAVPEGYDLKVEILDEKVRNVSNIVLAPAQPRYRCNVAAAPFMFDKELYNSERSFPEEPLEVTKVATINGLKIMRIGAYPLKSNLKIKALDVRYYMKIKASFVKKSEVKAAVLTTAMSNFLSSRVANFASIASKFVVKAPGAERMLIVVADSLKSEMTSFVDWKKSKGMIVDLVTLTDAGGAKDQVKQYIQDYYDKNTLTYLLFVGNATTMPTFTQSTGMGNAATDLPYTLLSKNHGGIPSVFYGRLVADNATEVKIQVDKIIQYEKFPQKGAKWYTQGTTIASNAKFAHPYDTEYASEIETIQKNAGYKGIDKFYEENKNATTNEISKAVNEGRSYITYVGHGSGTEWSSSNDPKFDVSSIQKLENEEKTPVVVDVACLNGSYNTLPKCFGKAWLVQTYKNKSAGAVGYYGASVSTYWHEPAIMSVGIAKSRFEKNEKHFGANTLAGQLYLVEKNGMTSQVKDNIAYYTLFGDPSLEVRAEIP
jgi:hypothetical protein